jgi:hypothetical protein
MSPSASLRCGRGTMMALRVIIVVNGCFTPEAAISADR